MFTIEKKIKAYNNIDFEMISEKERLVFFDIETTGLSPSHAQLYLIGLLHYEAGEWVFVQYFAEDMFDEEEMLSAFSELILTKAKKYGKPYLISYNGDNFDIPFLERCALQYKLDTGIATSHSLDLIKKVRALKKMLGLGDCKLKTVEKYLGIYREDVFGGGELIELYREYLRLNKTDIEGNREKTGALLKVLLLHNEEDILNMPYLVSMLSYEALMNGEFELESCALESNGGKSILNVDLKLRYALPVELYIEDDPFVISISEDGGDSFNFTAALCERELKHFFENYKDYYYLLFEDYAVHKSVGEFVDRSARKQATRKTAYIRKTGLYLEEPEDIYQPVFSEEYNSKTKYALFTEEMLLDKEKLISYISSVLKRYMKNKK